MNKKTKYGINWAIALGLINGGLNALRQASEIAINPDQKFDWKRFLIATGKGGIVGAGFGVGIGAIADYNNSKVKPLNTNRILLQKLDYIKLDVNSATHGEAAGKANDIVSFLWSEYSDDLVTSPIAMGSVRTGTALKGNSDFDYGLIFKPKSFQNTRSMYYDISSILKNNQKRLGVNDIREQKKSIGLYYTANGIQHKLDVVPYKATRNRSTSGYLHVNNKTFFTDNSSFTKTDIPVLNSLQLNKSQKQVLLLLKKWKAKNDLPLGSHLLQNLVVDAFNYNKGRVPYGISKQVIMTIEHISNNLETIRLRGIENSNNILSNIDSANKRVVIKACKKVVADYKYQPNSIVDIV